MGSPKSRGRRWSGDAQVVSMAVLSRLAVLSLAIILDLALPDHDPDPSVERPGPLPRLVKAFSRWDAAQFLKIAKAGYREEKDLAFFPLLPMAMKALAYFLQTIFPQELSLLLSGVIISNTSFVLATWLLYRLGLAFLTPVLALNGAKLFCFSPANIFFSSIYTESAFAASTFGGLLLLHLQRPMLAAAAFAVGGGLRSNGLLNLGFLLCHAFQKGSWSALFPILAGAAMVTAPFLTFQGFAVWKECGCEDQCPVEPRPWCQQWIPSSYGYIQAQYWKGGFLCYWEFKQLPNFLLAAPALALTLGGVRHLLLDFIRELGRVYGAKQPNDLRTWSSVVHTSLSRCPLLPHALHWGFLATYIFLFANVQIITRLLTSACPVFNWYLASLLFHREHRDLGRVLKFYVGVYNLLGIGMHVNFLPWT